MGPVGTASFVVWALVFLFLPVTAWAQTSVTGRRPRHVRRRAPRRHCRSGQPRIDRKGSLGCDRRSGPLPHRRSASRSVHVTFTLPGFTTVRRTGIELRAEFTATVDVELGVGTLAETITVSGEAPLVDTRSSRAQTQYAAETLESLPGNGRLSTLIAVLPGAVLNNEGDRASGGVERPVADPVRDSRGAERAARHRRHEHRDGGVEHRRLRLELAPPFRKWSPRRAASERTAIPAVCSST